MVVASLNIHGLNTHIDDLRIYIRDNGTHVLGINETKLGEDFLNHLVLIDGFEIVWKDREKLGGGVALYICSSVSFKVIDFLPTISLELLCIEILPKAAQPFFVVSFYWPHLLRSENLRNFKMCYLILSPLAEKSFYLVIQIVIYWKPLTPLGHFPANLGIWLIYMIILYSNSSAVSQQGKLFLQKLW